MASLQVALLPDSIPCGDQQQLAKTDLGTCACADVLISKVFSPPPPSAPAAVQVEGQVDREGYDALCQLMMWLLFSMLRLAPLEWALVPLCLGFSEYGMPVLANVSMVLVMVIVFRRKLGVLHGLRYHQVPICTDVLSKSCTFLDGNVEVPAWIPLMGHRTLPISKQFIAILASLPQYLEAASTATALPEAARAWSGTTQLEWKASWAIVPFLQWVGNFQLPTLLEVLLIVGMVAHATLFAFDLRNAHRLILRAKDQARSTRYETCLQRKLHHAISALREAAYQANLGLIGQWCNTFRMVQRPLAENEAQDELERNLDKHGVGIQALGGHIQLGMERLGARILFATGVKVWLKTSLAMHTWSVLSAYHKCNLVFAIAIGLWSICSIVPNQVAIILAIRKVIHFTPSDTTKYQVTQVVNLHYLRIAFKKEIVACTITTMISLALLARVAGLWLCSTHVLNLTSGCVDPHSVRME